jgi:flagellar protein FlaG
MDGIANVAKQQVQATSQQTLQSQQSQGREVQNINDNKNNNSSNKAIEEKNKEMIKDENQVKKLVDDLNSEISLLNTSLRFGVDKENTFYVSVIDKKTDKVIRRWPAEQAKTILPKMKELTGILFDTKG